VRFLHVTVGGHLGIGDKHFLIPVEAVPVPRISRGTDRARRFALGERVTSGHRGFSGARGRRRRGRIATASVWVKAVCRALGTGSASAETVLLVMPGFV
jgi:hypothetical protein